VYSEEGLGSVVSTRVFVISLIVAIIASSAITSAYLLSQTPAGAPVGKPLQSVNVYLTGTIDQAAVVVYPALQEGYFEQNGIAVTPVATSGVTAAIQALAADRSGFGFVVQGGIFNIVGLEAQNPNVTNIVSVASNGNVNPVGLLYLKSSGISQPSDLVGKTVGTASGSLVEQMFDAFLKRSGLEGKVNVQNIAFPQLAPALLTKKVDAVTLYVANSAGLEPQAEKIGDAISFFRLSDYGMPPVGFGILVQGTLINDHPDVVRAIVNATMTGIRFCILETTSCVADLVRAQPNFDYDTALLNTRAHWNSTWGPPFNDPEKVKSMTALQLGWQDPSSVPTIVELAEEAFGVSGIDPNSVYTNQFVEPP
jgi:ABC-type nitrate/sulfonate/bicarbonate transport system substrate-binding protein